MSAHLCSIGVDCRPGSEPRVVWDSAYLCGPCRTRLERWIAALPLLETELAETLIPPRRGGGGKPSYRNSWPINPHAVGLGYQLGYLFAGWISYVCRERGEHPPARNPTDSAAWLLIRLPWISHQSKAVDLYYQAWDLHTAMYRVVYPNPTKRLRLPKNRRACPTCETGTLTPLLGAGKPGIIQCDTCDHTWTPDQWFKLRLAILNKNRRVGAGNA